MTTETPTAPTEPDDPLDQPNRTSRRALLTGGAAVAGGVIGLTAARASASTYRTEQVSFDIACLGPTWREAERGNRADDADFRTAFCVEGLIYPPGTITADGFIPVTDGSIGRWICQGYVIIDATRPEPHTASHQDYHFGVISEEDLFPSTMLASVGLEGTRSRQQFSTRAVIGGTGDYMGATGQVTQLYTADNTSPFGPTGRPSPCWRFEFDLRIPD